MTKICIIGFGCVGSGTYEVLKQNKNLISERTGETVEVKYIVDIRDLSEQGVQSLVTTDYDKILADEEVSIIVETMGGTTFAYDYTKRALENKKNVVTSNKELVALKGDELFAIAKKNGVKYHYEAAVGGGIPIIRPVATSLSANNITEITGILNGTTNYILTNMVKTGMSFEEALKTAQKLGYAESNPTNDVDGFDTGKKISILSSMVLGKKVNFEDVYTKGISSVTAEDIAYAEAIDCVIKLIGKFKISENSVDVFVSPMLVPKGNPLFEVDDVFNAVLVNGDMVGETLFYGKGAGMLATASAVTGDILELISTRGAEYKIPWVSCDEKIVGNYEDIRGRFLVRFKSGNDMFERAISKFKKEKTFEVYEGEFALITSEMSVKELDEKLSDMDVVSKYMFI